MSYLYVKIPVKIDLKSIGFTVPILKEVLDIDEVSAEEFMVGIIPLKMREMKLIAKYISDTACVLS